MSTISFNNTLMRQELEEYAELLSNTYNSKLHLHNESAPKLSHDPNNKSGFPIPQHAKNMTSSELLSKLKALSNSTLHNYDINQIRNSSCQIDEQELAYLRELAAFERANNMNQNYSYRNPTESSNVSISDNKLPSQSTFNNTAFLEVEKSMFTMKWDISSISILNPQTSRAVYLQLSYGFNNADVRPSTNLDDQELDRQESEVINTNMEVVKANCNNQYERLLRQKKTLGEKKRAHKNKFDIQDTIKLLVCAKTDILKNEEPSEEFMVLTNSIINGTCSENPETKNDENNKDSSLILCSETNKTNKINKASSKIDTTKNSINKRKDGKDQSALLKSQSQTQHQTQKQVKVDPKQNEAFKQQRKSFVNSKVDRVLPTASKKFTITKAIIGAGADKNGKIQADDKIHKSDLHQSQNQMSTLGIKLKPSSKQMQPLNTRRAKTMNNLILGIDMCITKQTSEININSKSEQKNKVSTSVTPTSRLTKCASKQENPKAKRSISVSKTSKSKVPINNNPISENKHQNSSSTRSKNGTITTVTESLGNNIDQNHIDNQNVNYKTEHKTDDNDKTHQSVTQRDRIKSVRNKQTKEDH